MTRLREVSSETRLRTLQAPTNKAHSVGNVPSFTLTTLEFAADSPYGAASTESRLQD